MSALGEGYIAQHKVSGPIMTDSTGLGGKHNSGCLRHHARIRSLMELLADARTSKRFQKSTSDGNMALRRPGPDAPTTTGLRSNLGSRRRQSVRDQKEPPPSLALHSSPSKRFVHLYPVSSSLLTIPAFPITTPRDLLGQFLEPNINDKSPATERQASNLGHRTRTKKLPKTGPPTTRDHWTFCPRSTLTTSMRALPPMNLV